MRIILPFVLLSLLFSGCVRNNPLPIWLEINEWTLNENVAALDDQGEMTHHFSDVWVYVDNKIIGVFEVPCKIPVLVSGEKEIRLYPTIRNNGISSTKKIYPFVEAYEETLVLEEGKTYTINPETKYSAACEFWIEDFDGGSVKIQTDTDYSNATMTVESDPSISLTGDYGHIALSYTDSLWIGITTEALSLPSGKEVYLEINYRNTSSLLTGVKIYDSGGGTSDEPNVSLNAQSNSSVVWKKIYIDLKEIVSYSSNATAFKQYFKSVLISPSSTTTADVYLDNIKIIHF
jgi:hypothetical protein